MAKLDRGGAQLSLLRVAQSLVPRGVATRLLAAHASPEGVELAREHGVEPEVFGEAGNLQWVPHAGFAAWLEPRLPGADVVHAHMFGGWWAAAQVVADGQPLIASEHNAYRWPGPPHVRELREALRRVDRFFAHGPGSRRTVLDAGLPAGRIRSGISPVAGMDATVRPGLPARPVVFAGRLDPDKAPDVLLEAVALMGDRPPVIMLGAGRLEAELRAQRSRLGLEGQVEMPGWTDDPAPFIAAAAVLVIPSRDESFSQTAVLGMGLGVPVIGTDVDGLPDTLGGGRGIIVAPEDPGALAAAVEDVLAGRRTVDRVAARRFARQFEPERVAGIYEETYRGLTATGQAAAPVFA
ncbi:MAG: glycosyltransferase family 4 protein [Actinomycetota bacterium]|nr:glycosyltransferase family 4 protein [Actinomycetota bacterium]